MKTLVASAALLAALSTPALAGGAQTPTPSLPVTINNQPKYTTDVRPTYNNTVRNTVTNRARSESRARANSSSSSRSYSGGNSLQANTYEARDRLQAPGIAASFSSVQGSPCEGVPFGLGGSGPGIGALLQLPRESGNCWRERQAILLHQLGMTNAAIAVLAGNDVATAVGNNPVAVRRSRAIRAKY